MIEWVIFDINGQEIGSFRKELADDSDSAIKLFSEGLIAELREVKE